MIIVDWGNSEETLLIWRVHAKWNWKTFTRAIKKTKQLLATCDHEVYIMVDVRRSRVWDSRVLQIIHTAASQADPKRHHIIFIGSPIYKQLWKTAQRLYGVIKLPLFFVDTVDEAYQLLGEVV